MPLWVAIEMSKNLSKSKKDSNKCMQEIEYNLEYCSSSGRGITLKTIFPLLLTPEMVSIIFHLCGDGYLGGKGRMSHYRQVNQKGLENFSTKLRNCFGKFNTKHTGNSKVMIPRVISRFFRHYFRLNNCHWDTARISDEIKNLPKPYLLAGLTAFIIDEGSIGDTIEIYSSNKLLLEDMKEIITKIGYTCYGPRKKSKKEPKTYRIYISTKDALQFYNDIQTLKEEFPTGGLAHKEEFLVDIVRRQKRPWRCLK